jgi:cytochrome P450
MRDGAGVASPTTGAGGTSWDPHEPDVLRDQRTAYDEMRERCPVAHSEVMGWSLFRHGDVTTVTGDPVAFSSATRRLAIPNGMDPPEHTAYRGSLEPSFTSGRLQRFEPRSRQIARDLLAALVDRVEVEAIAGFVDPFAHQALCAFMGWPVEDWNRISGWTHGNLEAAFRSDREAGARLAREFAAYVTAILRARRGDDSSPDLMSDLVRVRVHDKTLDDDQIVGLLRTWTAGHGTVAAALGIVLRYLAEDVELQARLRSEPQLIQPAIWEILRSDGPLVSNTRTATRDVEIGGQAIQSGERISLMWIAANRDPAVFTNPREVVLDRGADDNLLFGAGIHRCLGESLAILNLRVALEELLQAIPSFGSGAPGAPSRSVYPSNGLRVLPLRLGPLAMAAR